MPAGTVYYHCARSEPFLRTHEGVTQERLARAIAGLKGYDFCARYEPAAAAMVRGSVFFVPDETLVGFDAAKELGICRPQDLFGGVVAHAFARTKAIAHPLVAPDAARPSGWSERFSARVRDVVLPGFTAFGREDARAAAARLLDGGAVRLKRTVAAGGRGQWVIRSMEQLGPALEHVADDELSEYGVVIEANLSDVSTYSVGQVLLDDLVVTYHGTQHETSNNDGAVVYGGSDLVLARGGFGELLRLELPPDRRRAVALATAFDEAAHEELGVMASRRNYDVAAGVDGRRRAHRGVLEQSWRIGGASAAEVAALAAFQDDPAVQVVRASSIERYGTGHAAPADATVHFDGVDPEAGPVLRYARVAARSTVLR